MSSLRHVALAVSGILCVLGLLVLADEAKAQQVVSPCTEIPSTVNGSPQSGCQRVGPKAPLPTEQVVQGVTSMTSGTTVLAATRFACNVSTTGNVTVTFVDGSSSTYPLSVGLNVFPFAVTQYNSLTATGTCENWH